MALPLSAHAQQADRVWRIGIVMPYPKGDAENEARVAAFRQELAKLGWAEGRNVHFDERWTTDSMDVVRAEAASLMASSPDVTGGRVIPVLMQLSHSIPIVLAGGADPVVAGYAKTLARPGGNVTGFTFLEFSMIGKSLEMLKQIAPAIVRVALIYNPDNPNTAIARRAAETASQPLAIEPIAAPIHGLSDIDRVVTNLAVNPNSGIFFFPDVSTLALRQEIVELIATACQQCLGMPPS
jgi:putative tryptophan/tyrosine transport system substrate-binding protein